MPKQQLEIKDFNLFAEVLKSATKIVDSAKLTFNENGLEIYGARAKAARCEIVSNAVVSAEPVEFCVEDLQMFLKIVHSVQEVHANDYSGLKFFVDLPFVRFESKKFKNKYSTCNESLISAWVSKKIETEMTPIFEFTGTSDMIKRLCGNAFMFSVAKDVRIYLETKDDMEHNAVFATLGNKETELNNEITLKFGLVTAGSLVERDETGAVTGERKIILDFERLALFNAIQSNDIKFSLMNLNCLVSKTQMAGENGTFFKLNVYSTILKC